MNVHDEENGTGSLLGGGADGISHQDSLEYGGAGQQPKKSSTTVGGSGAAPPRPSNTNSMTSKIQQRLAQMRDTATAAAVTTRNGNGSGGAYAPMKTNNEIDVGYKAPSLGYSDMPSSGSMGGGQAVTPASRLDGSMMTVDGGMASSTTNSTTFAPVSLPPTHMGESTFSITDHDDSAPHGVADGDNNNMSSSAPFLMDRERISGMGSSATSSDQDYNMISYMTTCAKDVWEIIKMYSALAWEKYYYAPTWAQIVIGLIILAIFIKIIDAI